MSNTLQESPTGRFFRLARDARAFPRSGRRQRLLLSFPNRSRWSSSRNGLPPSHLEPRPNRPQNQKTLFDDRPSQRPSTALTARRLGRDAQSRIRARAYPPPPLLPVFVLSPVVIAHRRNDRAIKRKERSERVHSSAASPVLFVYCGKRGNAPFCVHYRDPHTLIPFLFSSPSGYSFRWRRFRECMKNGSADGVFVNALDRNTIIDQLIRS